VNDGFTSRRSAQASRLNRQQWGNPNLDPTSTNFGKVTTVTQNYMRFFTFGAKLNF